MSAGWNRAELMAYVCHNFYCDYHLRFRSTHPAPRICGTASYAKCIAFRSLGSLHATHLAAVGGGLKPLAGGGEIFDNV